tara:strand:+ start:1075 stop:1227 length:153 start_codon:yes stop_codon:yes gene_type:complete
MKFNKKVPFIILVICLFLTLISVYQEYEKKALYGNSSSPKLHDAKTYIKD